MRRTRASRHGCEAATLVAPATGVAPDDGPAIPCPAHHEGMSPVTLRRRRVSPLPCLMCAVTSYKQSPRRQAGRLVQVLPSPAVEIVQRAASGPEKPSRSLLSSRDGGQTRGKHNACEGTYNEHHGVHAGTSSSRTQSAPGSWRANRAQRPAGVATLELKEDAMIGDTFIIDAVVHGYHLSPDNQRSPA